MSTAPPTSDAARTPDEPLGLTVHALPSVAAVHSAEEVAARTRRGRLRMLLVLAVCAAPVIASYLTYYVIRPQGRTNYGELVQPTRTIPAAAGLTRLDGTPVDPMTLKDQWLLISVGPAACPADCEQRLLAQRQLRTMLGKERDRLDRVWIVRDDAPVAEPLRHGLEGGSEPATVLRATPAWLAGWLQPAAGHTIDEHFYIVDPQGEWMMRTPANPDPGRVKRDLERLLKAAAGWDHAGR